MAPEIPVLSPSPPRRRRLFKAIVFGVLPLVALAGLAKWGIAPCFVRRHISGWLAERSYARLEMKWASVGFREIRLYGVSLTDRAGRVYGTADSIVVQLDRPMFGFGKPAIRSLRLVRPDLSITLESDGHFDLQKILKRPPEAPPRSPNPIHLPAAFDVEGGMLHFNSSFLKTTFGKFDAPIRVLANRYEWTTVEGQALGGRASLSGHIGREGDDTWAMQLNVQDASVHAMTRGTTLESKQIDGRLNGFLSLVRGEGEKRGAIGAGWIDIDEGKLVELPVLLSVFNVLRLSLPGDSAVRECRTDFRLLPDRLHFDRFFILTPGICLFGDGDVFLASHEIDIDFIPRLIGDLPPGVEDLRGAINPATDLVLKNFLFDIKVKGTWTEPEPRPLPIPIATKPFADLVAWMLGAVKKK